MCTDEMITMEKMGIILKGEYPEQTKAVCAALELLAESVEQLDVDLWQEIILMILDGRQMDTYDHMHIGKSLKVNLSKINELIKRLDVGEFKEVVKPKVEIIPDGDALLLSDDLTGRKPIRFRIGGDLGPEVSSWRDLFVAVCTYLADLDEGTMMDFELDPSMNGRSRIYFSQRANNLSQPEQVSDNMFVEYGLNPIGIQNRISDMLVKYHIEQDDFKIYVQYEEIVVADTGHDFKAIVDDLNESFKEVDVSDEFEEFDDIDDVKFDITAELEKIVEERNIKKV